MEMSYQGDFMIGTRPCIAGVGVILFNMDVRCQEVSHWYIINSI
jgi:hypothetical protein